MDVSNDYCEFCDLPLSQCVHGQPPPTPAKQATKPARTSPAPRKRSAARARPAAPEPPVRRRWTPPEVFKPLIVTLLEQAGGELEADEALLELEILAEERLLPGDRERTPEGEPRWQYAARRARVALLAEGVMTKTSPGVWRLS